MAETTYKMEAQRSFEGTEGMIRRGEVFEVDSKERADELERLGLALPTDNDATVTNFEQRNRELNSMTKDELKKVAEDENVTYADNATKDDIKNAIIQNRTNEFITAQAEQAAGTQTSGTDSGTDSADTNSGQ